MKRTLLPSDDTIMFGNLNVGDFFVLKEHLYRKTKEYSDKVYFTCNCINISDIGHSGYGLCNMIDRVKRVEIEEIIYKLK